MPITRINMTSLTVGCLVCLASLASTRARGQEIIVYRPPIETSTIIESPTATTMYYALSSPALPTTTWYAPTVVPNVTYYHPPAVASQVTPYDAQSPSVVYRAPLVTTTYYAPGLVNSTPLVVPTVPVYVVPRYVPGQPVRNVFRALAP